MCYKEVQFSAELIQIEVESTLWWMPCVCAVLFVKLGGISSALSGINLVCKAVWQIFPVGLWLISSPVQCRLKRYARLMKKNEIPWNKHCETSVSVSFKPNYQPQSGISQKLSLVSLQLQRLWQHLFFNATGHIVYFPWPHNKALTSEQGIRGAGIYDKYFFNKTYFVI